jgi:hypothetical protein
MPNRRPRSPDADAEAAASIKQAEDLGLVPVGAENPTYLDVSQGTTTKERDYRANPPRRGDSGALPFKVTP